LREILHAFVPENSQIRRCVIKIFIHNNSTDLVLRDKHHKISNLYVRKQGFYSENKNIPRGKLKDLRAGLIAKVKKLVKTYAALIIFALKKNKE
jgi:hypothetical protein